MNVNRCRARRKPQEPSKRIMDAGKGHFIKKLAQFLLPHVFIDFSFFRTKKKVFSCRRLINNSQALAKQSQTVQNANYTH